MIFLPILLICDMKKMTWRNIRMKLVKNHGLFVDDLGALIKI